MKMTPEEILSWIPHQKPFRFVDSIISIEANRVIGQYRYKSDEYFYTGHFPGYPITPGVILLETMCQVGLAALGIFNLNQDLPNVKLAEWGFVFCDARLDLLKPVFPETTVTVEAKKNFWRFKKLNCEISMKDQQGAIVARATAAGLGFKINERKNYPASNEI